MSFVVMGRFIKGCTDAGLALVVLSDVVQVQLKLSMFKARRTHSRLCLLTTQLNRREQTRSRLVGVHCHDGAIQTWRFSQAIWWR